MAPRVLCFYSVTSFVKKKPTPIGQRCRQKKTGDGCHGLKFTLDIRTLAIYQTWKKLQLLYWALIVVPKWWRRKEYSIDSSYCLLCLPMSWKRPKAFSWTDGQLPVSKVLDWEHLLFGFVCLLFGIPNFYFYFLFFGGSILWCTQSSDHLEEDLTKFSLKKIYEIKNI